jgi:hypothetical protein
VARVLRIGVGAAAEEGSNEDAVVSALLRRQCLLVLDSPDLDLGEVRAFLGRLLSHVRDVKLVVTGALPLSAAAGHSPLFSAGEKVSSCCP